MPEQRLFAVMWGVIAESGGRYPLAQMPQLLDKLKSLGYSGIELPVVYVMQYGTRAFESLLLERGMKVITDVFTSGAAPIPGDLGVASQFGIEHPKTPANSRDVAAHKAIFAGQVQEALQMRASGALQSINSHTGRDYWTNEEADDMFSYCTAYEKEHNVLVHHETHRGRVLYSPWVVPRVLAAHPDLKLCADLSHFSCVAESNPYEGEINKVVAALTPAVRHVHARVGFEEGPQIPDPRTPTWSSYMEGYKVWWKGIYEAAKARGDPVISTTPEFGPPPYAWTNPYAKDAPVVNVWDVNHWVGQQMGTLFADVFGSGECKLADDPEKGVWTL